MDKFGRSTILDVLECAMKEFTANDALSSVEFYYHGHLVTAYFVPIPNEFGWIVSSFKVDNSCCVITYTLGVDYDVNDACFED